MLDELYFRCILDIFEPSKPFCLPLFQTNLNGTSHTVNGMYEEKKKTHTHTQRCDYFEVEPTYPKVIYLKKTQQQTM